MNVPDSGQPRGRASLSGALRRIARIVSESLELREVFAQVAEVAAEVLPFERMGVCRLESSDRLRLYAVAGSPEGGEPSEDELAESEELASFDAFSPAMRPRTGPVQRIDETRGVLDPSYPMDARLQELGMRSGLGAPLMSGGRLAGQLWFTSTRPAAFDRSHEDAARAIGDILALSLEHERLWSLDASRRRRLDAIDSLLPTLAGTLDVREIFHRMSEIVRPVLAHDRMVLTTLGTDGSALIVEASSGDPVAGLPTRLPEPDGTCNPGGPAYLLVPDVAAHPERCGAQVDPEEAGMRSLLGFPLHLDGPTRWLLFASLEPESYSEEDVLVGRRVADHVSLALSHQRLAEEHRLAAEARDRATRLERRVQALRQELESSLGYRKVIGEASTWKEVLNQAAKVAQTETTVLLTGESGTGKEVVARLIHRGSPRAKGPFVAINCAALPETLLESELFGHERGAFTGATSSRPGRIEQAAGGVLFLDEVAEMSPTVQAKLLRVLQEREYQRLGGSHTVQADVRVVAATNRDLEAAIARGDFREDLFYRLRVFEIRLPALRERVRDIPLLAEAFLDEIGGIVGRKAAGLSPAASELLVGYAWPGNVRELRNALERATIMCDGGPILPEHLPIATKHRPAVLPAHREAGFAPARPGRPAAPVLPVGPGAPALPGAPAAQPAAARLDEVERDLIVRALLQADNNRSRAARLLGITRSQLYTRIQKYGLS